MGCAGVATSCRKKLTCREFPTYIAPVASPDRICDRIFTALANPVRRKLLEILSCQSLSAGELSERFDLSRPAVAEHLKVLREAGLVADEAQGRRRIAPGRGENRHGRIGGRAFARLVHRVRPVRRQCAPHRVLRSGGEWAVWRYRRSARGR